MANHLSSITYLLVFLLGLAGGFSHCIGMCGIFVVSYSSSPDDPPGEKRPPFHPLRHALFHGGRLASLGALGVVAGFAGGLTHVWASTGAIFSIVAGIALLGLALGFAGIAPWFHIPEPDMLGAGGGFGRKLFLKALRNKGGLKPLLIGIFVGLLPCGLTYQSLIMSAATGSVLSATLCMLLFGLGTIPGLLTLGVFGGVIFGGILMRPAFRTSMTRVAAAILAVMAIAFIIRGWQFLG